MALRLLVRLFILMELMPGLLMHQTHTIGKKCPCQLMTSKGILQSSLGDDAFFTDMTKSISCCKHIYLGYHDPGASIQWSFNGEPYSDEWGSSLKFISCGDEIIETESAKVTDRGNYSCTITATNGTTKTLAMTMTMERKADHRDVPKDMTGSSDAMALDGERVKFTCESFVGTNDTYRQGVDILWRYFNATTLTFASFLPNVNISQASGSGGSWGKIKGELVISSVQEEHFGIYECIVRNYYGALSHNISLTKGIPAAQARILRYKIIVLVVAGLLGLVVSLLFCWCRWSRLILLYCRHRTPSSEHYQYDLFLVHGESASRFVWSILLPALEDSFGYTCFLPQRDMCGGSMVAESIHEALAKCRRVVVVMTPCILDSPWATWATYSGIQTALTSRSRILALVNKEESFINGPLDPNPFLSALRVVKKIKVPQEFVWDICEKKSPLHHPDTPIQKTNVQKMEQKLALPESDVSTSSSNSLSKSQRLSNMISGSTSVSREDLECNKDKTTEAGGPVTFKCEDQGLQEPGSPSFNTPFILPSQRKPFRTSTNGSVCKFVRWFLQMVCVGSPEEQFWQTLRLHLGSPSFSRPKAVDK